ncbi:MAG TPA: hypothetical protein VHZ95_12585, partial [Polyangiales bacterium]|nr:hypothetical protein [Polyangiales bacterium]
MLGWDCVRRICALALLCLAACSGSKHHAPAPPTTNDRDSGSSEVDAGQPAIDAGHLQPDEDSGSPDPGLTGTCAIDSNKIFTVVEQDTPFLDTPLAVDPINSRFVLPYVGEGDCLQAVFMAGLVGAADGGGPVSDKAIDECSLVLGASAAAISGNWLVALVDNRAPPYDLWIEPYDPIQKTSGSAVRISQTETVEHELAIATLRNGDHAMVAWSDEDPKAGQALYVRPLDSSGTPTGDAVRIDHSSTLYYRGLALTELGADGAGFAYLRYSQDFTTSDIVFVALDANGKALRDPWLLASNAGPSASVSLVNDEDGGGIVYARAEATSGRQLWFQQIDDSGQAAAPRSDASRAPPLRFVNSPFKGIDVSIAKLSTSFVVTYRSLPAGDQDRAEIKLYFLDRFGAVIGGSSVSYTSA